MEYRIATHAGSGMVRHTLEHDRLVVLFEKSDRREEVAFSEVTRVRLLQELHGVHTLELSRKEGSKIRITARHFVSLGKFEQRGSEYVPFVRQLLKGVHQHSEGTHFVTGSSTMYVLGWVFVVFGVLFSAFSVWALLSTKAPPRQVLYVVPIMLIIGGAFVKQGSTKTFDPGDPPAKFLPSPTG